MSVLKVIEVLADSTTSWEDAAAKGIEEASKSLRGIKSAFVQNQSVTVENGKIASYRVNLKITFAIES